MSALPDTDELETAKFTLNENEEDTSAGDSESDSDSASNSSCHSSDDDDTDEERTGDVGNKRKRKGKKDGGKRKKQRRTAPSGKPATKAKTSKRKTAMPTVTASPLASVADDISLPSTSSTAMETSNNNTASQSASSTTPKTAVASTNTTRSNAKHHPRKTTLSAYEKEREANIIRNAAMLATLGVKEAAVAAVKPSRPKPRPTRKSAPVGRATRASHRDALSGADESSVGMNDGDTENATIPEDGLGNEVYGPGSSGGGDEGIGMDVGDGEATGDGIAENEGDSEG